MSTGEYAAYYTDHRMEGLWDYVGWDLETLDTLPFMVWVRRMEIDCLRPARGDQEITITSFVREFRGPEALIECAMVDSGGTNGSRCLMTVPTLQGNQTREDGGPTSWRCSSKKKPHERLGRSMNRLWMTNGNHSRNQGRTGP